jgi:hypothetical protein
MSIMSVSTVVQIVDYSLGSIQNSKKKRVTNMDTPFWYKHPKHYVNIGNLFQKCQIIV